MHKLVRAVRFSINPFLPADADGFNSFASKPAGDGLAIFFELSVGLAGQVERRSGFIVNVNEIDDKVRRFVVPIFAERVRNDFRRRSHIGFSVLAGLLRKAKETIAPQFPAAMVTELTLKLNPFRKLAIDCEDYRMIYFSEKFEFASTHRLWNEQLSEQQNIELFGKCAHPSGHGHNYLLEVTVKMPQQDCDSFRIASFEQAVEDELISLLDHRNLNVDVPQFAGTNPTVENIAVFAWGKIVGKLGNGASLHCVTVWETDKTYCSYYG